MNLSTARGGWPARQRYLIDYALAAMARHRAKNLGLLAVFSVLVFVLASVVLLGGALRREAAEMLAEAPDVIVQGMRMGRHETSRAADIAQLGRMRGVERIEGRLWGYLYDTSTASNYTLQVPSPHAGASRASRGERSFGGHAGHDARDVAAPRPPATPADYSLADGETIVGEGVARLRKRGPGGFIFLVSPAGEFLKLRIKSVMDERSGLVTSDMVLLTEADFRRFFRLRPDEYTDIAITVRNPREVVKVSEKAALALREHRVITRPDILRTYEAVFRWREGMLLALLSGALLAFGILAFDKASGLSAQERREIGILKAIGWDTGDVLRMKLWEAALISVTAFLAGALAAYAHVFVFSAPLFEPVLAGWTMLYPRFRLTPQVDLFQLTTLGVLVVLPYLAAILVPIWRTASAEPDAVMR